MGIFTPFRDLTRAQRHAFVASLHGWALDAFGIVPAHLNELSPPGARAILLGFAYQFGNLVMSRLSPIQAGFAESNVNEYALALSWTVGLVGLLLAIVVMLGREKKSVELHAHGLGAGRSAFSK